MPLKKKCYMPPPRAKQIIVSLNFCKRMEAENKKLKEKIKVLETEIKHLPMWNDEHGWIPRDFLLN